MNLLYIFRRKNDPNNAPATEPPKPIISPPPVAPPQSDRFTNAKGEFLINRAGFELVKHFEGCYLHAYPDSVGVSTIGWGRIKYDDGSFVKIGDSCTQQEADQWLLEDLEKDGGQYVRAINKTYYFDDNEFSALCGFCYNRGAGRLRQLIGMSTGEPGIGNNLPYFNYAQRRGQNIYLLGLDRRRYAERELFFSRDWHKFDTVSKFVAFKEIQR